MSGSTAVNMIRIFIHKDLGCSWHYTLWLFLTLVNYVTCNAHLPKLLLISLDGFRWDYLDRGYNTPNIDSIARRGVIIDSMRNAYMTKTFPNHVTIVTGAYEETHGIVANEMYDPLFNETFHVAGHHTVKEMRKWYDNAVVEPIWWTNQKAGQGRASGTAMWPTSDAWKGRLQHVVPYNKTLPFRNRIDILVKWFSDRNNPINFGTLYYEEPDEAGHEYGPDSPEIQAVVEGLDRDIGYLLHELGKLDLLDTLNIILTSDHGMARTTKGVVELDRYVESWRYTIANSNMVCLVFPNDKEQEDVIFKKLTEVDIPHIKVWRRKDIPNEYHYQHHRRISSIVIQADEGWVIVQNQTRDRYNETGNHGYNNSLKDMHPIFLAAGPAFRNGREFKTSDIQNVDIYPLMCYILNVKPATNNGSLPRIKRLLKFDFTTFIRNNEYVIVVVCVSIIAVLVLIGAVVCLAKRAIRSKYEFVGWDDEISSGEDIKLTAQKNIYHTLT